MPCSSTGTLCAADLAAAFTLTFHSLIHFFFIFGANNDVEPSIWAIKRRQIKFFFTSSSLDLAKFSQEFPILPSSDNNERSFVSRPFKCL